MYLGEKVDLIITYVNYKDKNWQKDYEEVARTRVNPAMMERFRSFGTLRYLLRGVDKFMPYVDRVILIVSKRSQLPHWLNEENVKVVLHEDYIPAIKLPTFNSCTIETYFYRLKDLNPYVIYTNDDIYPLQMSTPEEFFTDGIPNTHFKFYAKLQKDNIFRRQCKNGADMIFNVLKETGWTKKDNPIFFKPDHCMSAMKRETFESVGNLCGEQIHKTTTPFRSIKNVNQHIYLYYQYFMGLCFEQATDYEYVTFNNGIDYICDHIRNPRHNFMCLNDDGLMSADYDTAKHTIQKAFSILLPEKSRFEL